MGLSRARGKPVSTWKATLNYREEPNKREKAHETVVQAVSCAFCEQYYRYIQKDKGGNERSTMTKWQRSY